MSSLVMISNANKETNKGCEMIGGVNREIAGGLACINGVNRELNIGESEYVNKMFGYRTQYVYDDGDDDGFYKDDTFGLRVMTALGESGETVSSESFNKGDGIYDRLFEVDGTALYEWDLSSFTKTKIATLSVSLTDIGGTYDRLFGINGNNIYEIDLDTFELIKVATSSYSLSCCAGSKDALFVTYNNNRVMIAKYSVTDTGLSLVSSIDSGIGATNNMSYSGKYMGGTQDYIYLSGTMRTSGNLGYSKRSSFDAVNFVRLQTETDGGTYINNSISANTCFRYAGVK